jgi:hypothetical protein
LLVFGFDKSAIDGDLGHREGDDSRVVTDFTMWKGGRRLGVWELLCGGVL